MTRLPAAVNVNANAAAENAEQLLNIQTAANRFHTGRVNALNAMPNADTVRDLGRRIRAHTISNLDQYLVQFEKALTALGGKVHWAQDANEACEIIDTIAQKANVRTVVKSKSMVTEEIKLNAHLESKHLEVVETDLGEYIAQLSGDHPSHIIAPIAHLNRKDVGRIFNKVLGEDYTEEIPELNAIARRALRKKFLSADMGITGCNFAVAETGTICLVTNEGNARMSTSLPRVHVAVMGMERIVPTIEDLGVMLQLLARSATGQKMSTYTTLVTGPNRSGSADGPEEMHVIILDNGRSKALGGDKAEILYCIRCAACVNACPVYANIGGHAYGSVYSGPIGSVVSPILGGIPLYGDLPHASTLCGACRDACPVRIDLPALLLRLRRDTVQQRISPSWLKISMKAYKSAATKPKLFAWLTRMAELFSRFTGQRWLSWLPGPLNGWTRFRAFPPFSQSFQHQRKREHDE